MTAVIIEYSKLLMIFLLIGTIIGLSSFGTYRREFAAGTPRRPPVSPHVCQSQGKSKCRHDLQLDRYSQTQLGFESRRAVQDPGRRCPHTRVQGAEPDREGGVGEPRQDLSAARKAGG